ncbi:MAG: GGDEF domain-containing protein, partial [Eubacterium sp.]|nr:GGDEF domain-containing protein [Eubacterium sp.]
MKLRWYGIALIIVTCICAAIALGFSAGMTDGSRDLLESEFSLRDFSEGWSAVTPFGFEPVTPGETVDTGGSTEVTIVKNVFPERAGGNILVFENNRQCVEVIADGETVFSLGAGNRAFQMSTTGYCAAALPTKGYLYTVEVRFVNLNEGKCILPEFYCTCINDLLVFCCMKDLFTLSCIPLWAVIAIFLLAFSIIIRKKKHSDRRIPWLAVILFLVFFWNVTDLHLISLFPIDLEFNTILSHYLLMAMPIPMLFFIHFSCKKRKLIFLQPILFVLLGNIILQTVLFLSNTVSLHNMLFISQGLILLLMIYGAAALHLDYRAFPTKDGKIQKWAFVICSFIGGSAVLAYWLHPSDWTVYRTIFQVAILVFLVLMLGVMLFKEGEINRRILVQDAERMAYQAVSVEDQLTNLKNRRAFELHLKEIEEKPEAVPNAMLIFMDLNGLKYVNDYYGHLAGDELILSASKCVREGFESRGTVYRIGG